MTKIAISAVLVVLLVACADGASPDHAPRASPNTNSEAPDDSVEANLVAQATASAAAATAHAALAESELAQARVERVAVQGTTTARATDQALAVRTTEVALEATQSVAAFTATAEAAAASATAMSWQLSQAATADAASSIARAAQVQLAASATAMALQQHQERVAAEWERDVLLPAKTVALVVLMLICIIGIVLFGARLFNALILHLRIIRDPSGHAIVFQEADGVGRQLVLLPNRSPGAAIQIAPSAAQLHHVVVGAADPDVTMRAQTLEGLAFASKRESRGVAPSTRPLLPEPGALRVLNAQQLPPPSIADSHALQVIDADWRVAEPISLIPVTAQGGARG